MAENSCFGEIHQELDAKLIPCGKWNLPLFYPGGSVAEHRNSRSGAGIFDQSGIRCFQIAGKNAAGVLEENLLYPVAGLAVGCAAENLLLSGEGRVAAVFTLCRMKEDDFMLLLQRSTAEKDVVYLKQLFSTIPIVRELTENMAFLTVAGSRSREILQEAGADGLPENGKWQMITILDEEGDQFRCIAMLRVRREPPRGSGRPPHILPTPRRHCSKDRTPVHRNGHARWQCSGTDRLPHPEW